MTKTHTPTSNYQHFDVSIYSTVYDVQKMADLNWLTERFDAISRVLHVDKIYLETHRDTVMAEEETVVQAREFFRSRGVCTAGGITLTVMERNRFQTYCYTNPEHRQRVQEIVEYTARLFDELILDDFFFTNCKCTSCIEAKDDQSWTQFRLALMAEAAQNLVVGPAKAINPRIKVVIKYPNWYEHFQGLGFNLEAEPPIFDGLYTGTETRDPVLGTQHFQAYHGYSIFRYFHNIKPGGNGGGWVDPFASFTLDRYAEQLWLTLLAKAPEITLFHFGQLERHIQESQRAPWQDVLPAEGNVRFDFDDMIASVQEDADPTDADTWSQETTLALAAGHAFQHIDPVLGLLGKPVGIKSYRPHHATGEDFLHSYLGMLGIPIDLGPEFPAGEQTILLTESAKADPGIVFKIEQQVRAGKSVVVTSGLFKALQDKGIRDIVELTVTDRKASVQDYQVGWFGMHHGESPILVPHIDYMTNDSWEEISGQTRNTGHPILHSASYAEGVLYVLTIPDNYDDLYKLPVEVLSRIRSTLMADLYVQVNGPAQVALFVYNNDTFVVESFLAEEAEIEIVVGEEVTSICDAMSGEALSGEPILDWRGQSTGKVRYGTTVAPHALRVFRCEHSRVS